MLFSKKVYRSITAKAKPFTPDVQRLEQQEYCLLFVPDVFMARHPNNRIIKPYSHLGQPLGSGFTQDADWGFWKFKDGWESFAIPMVNPNKHITFMNKVGRIKGEIWAIRPYMFWYALDEWYQNRVEFVRIRVNIVLPIRRKLMTKIGEIISDELTDTIRCWMYIGRPAVWLDKLDGGLHFSPVTLFEQKRLEGRWNAGKYFYWSLNEYKDSTTTHTLSELSE